MVVAEEGAFAGEPNSEVADGLSSLFAHSARVDCWHDD